MRAELYLRKLNGYECSAWMLEHSLQDNPSDEWRDNNSRIAGLINNDPAYLSKLDEVIRASTTGVIDENLEGVKFKTGDLYYSIHKAAIHVNGYKQENGSWLVKTTVDDTYDFTEIQTFMDDNNGWSAEAGLGTVANDVAVVSQLTGAIHPYHITI